MDYTALIPRLLAGEPPRSVPFRDGMAAVLRNRVDGSLISSPYDPGTSEDDAFFAGRLRGHNEFRNLLIEFNGDRTAAIGRLQALALARVA